MKEKKQPKRKVRLAAIDEKDFIEARTIASSKDRLLVDYITEAVKTANRLNKK